MNDNKNANADNPRNTNGSSQLLPQAINRPDIEGEVNDNRKCLHPLEKPLDLRRHQKKF